MSLSAALGDLLPAWLPRPGPLFNPLISPPEALPPAAQLAGPMGLLIFVPLIPLVLLAGRWQPRAALVVSGLAWLLLTARPTAALVLLGGVAAATGWLLLLARLRRREHLNRRGMIALVWLGLHALILPLWWWAQQPWYLPLSPMAALHTLGFAYFLLRYIAWGVALADDPRQPLRPVETLCWIVYPPCMRLGPVLLREQFLGRLAVWDPRRSPNFWAGAARFGMCLVGAVSLGAVLKNIPPVLRDLPADDALATGAATGALDFFAAPQLYATGELLRVFYLVPIEVYLLLWTYNQLALAASLWIGIPVDNNFNYVPLATSVRDFWRRWHVTVGAWLRTYMYIPLGGNRRHVTLNYILVFGYCGIWHGASWSFLAWGLSQAVALVVQRWWDTLRDRLGWPARPRHALAAAAWTAMCWLVTMHYQLATVVMFTDFEHLGLRLFRELLGRFSA
ncbi:MAG: MBOAT family O-acyltransferase [Planctomycetota bacterium]